MHNLSPIFSSLSPRSNVIPMKEGSPQAPAYPGVIPGTEAILWLAGMGLALLPVVILSPLMPVRQEHQGSKSHFDLLLLVTLLS